MLFKEVTKRQKLFLVTYPFIHCIITVVAVLMSICTGIFPEPRDPPPTATQLVMSAIGSKLANFLMAPIMLLRNWGIRTHGPFSDYALIFFVGIVYGIVWLYLYKKVSRN